jgi:hypothetical protein
MESKNSTKWLLRWRYDFISHPVKYGQWDRSATLMTDMACYNLKEGLIRASIEAKDILTREIKTIVEVDGQNFCNFQWIAITRSPAIHSGTMNIRANNVGLRLIGRYTSFEVYKDGTVVMKERSIEDQKFNFAIYGR